MSFPAGKRVDARYKGFTIQTDQSRQGGGEGAAPEPFDLFLASIATCGGVHEIRPPEGFPQKHRDAVVRAAELCAVKKHILEPPTFEIRTA